MNSPQSQPPQPPANKPDPLAGGVFIALFAVIGTIAGAWLGEPSAGLIIGLVAGGIVALLVALAGRR